MWFGREPARWMAVGTTGLIMAISFGLPITEEQKINLLTFAASIMALITGEIVRANVTPTEKIEAAGLDPKTLKAAMIGLLCASLMFSSACAFFNRTGDPVRAIAASGITLSEAMTKARQTSTELYNEKSFPFECEAPTNCKVARDRYEKVLKAFETAQSASVQVADALAIYNAQPNATNAQKVTALLATLDQAWPEILKELGGASLPARLLEVVGQVNEILRKVRAAVGAPAPPTTSAAPVGGRLEWAFLL